MEIKDLIGLSKPLEKLIEVVSKGTGVLYEPTRIKRKAMAEAEALKIKSKVIEEVCKLHGGAAALALVVKNEKLEFLNVSKFVDRTKASKQFRDEIEQRNIENIVANSIKYLGEEPVSSEEVDIDWRTRFFAKAKEVSKDEMQDAWGKVLAGEVRKPGTYSLRSLEVLNNMTASEAELFRKFSTFAELQTGYILIPHKQVRRNGFNNNFPYGTLLELEDCGVIKSQHDLGATFELQPSIPSMLQYNCGILVMLNKREAKVSIRMEVLVLTNCGRELLPLVDSDVWPEDYKTQMVKKYKNLELQFIPKSN